MPGILCRLASELASRSAFVASMRTTESSASVAEADANNQGNNDTLRNIELVDDGPYAREPWLLEMLKAPGADWWLHAGQAGVVCKKLRLLYNELAYSRDIYVWLPDVCWGTEAMPPCVICKTQRRFPLMTFKQNILDIGCVH